MKTSQLNLLFKNTERPQKFCGNAVKEKGNTSNKKVFKNTETPQRFCGNA